MSKLRILKKHAAKAGAWLKGDVYDGPVKPILESMEEWGKKKNNDAYNNILKIVENTLQNDKEKESGQAPKKGKA